MINIKQNNGKWNNHEWYLLNHSKKPEYIFYAPTLKLALLLTSKLGTDIVQSNVLPQSIIKILERQAKNPIYPIYERPQAFHLAIGLTNNCTLACEYCHAEADKNINIDKNIIEKAIYYAFEQAGKTPKRILSSSFAVGGEPTLNWDGFTYAVDLIRELESKKFKGVDKVFLAMTTNCYYGKKKREYISRNFDTLTLSIDGDEDIQNLHRPTISQEGSYNVVKETIQYFLSCENLKVGLRGTVSKTSVGKLVEIVEHFNTEFGNGYTVAFEPLIEVGRALKSALLPPNNDEFALNYWDAKKRGKELGIRVITSAANVERLVSNFCGAMSIPSFTVCTDGQITACHRDQDAEDYQYGHFDAKNQTFSIDKAKIERNIKETILPDFCNDCFAKWHCAGDCPYIRTINYSRCDINCFLIFQQLYEILKHNGKYNPLCDSNICL